MNDNRISGIRCHVTNCTYHKGDSTCTAGCIEVGNSKASRSDETECSTFICRDGCEHKG